MCQGVGIRGNACNIDTPVISDLKCNLNVKSILIYIKFGNI